jgi:hypothetical protein
MRFAALIVMAMTSLALCGQEAGSCACCSEGHRAFDFWVGEWEVVLPDGSPAGTNLVTREQGGCLIREQWKSAKGGLTGTSVNFYQAVENRWEQIWMDSDGNVLRLFGGLEGNRMVLASEPFIGQQGKHLQNRITWTPSPDGTVRQLWEVLENGQVVQTVFDGSYRRAGS